MTLPRPTYDHCVVALNKTAILMTGGIGQESQAILMDLKAKKWYTMSPMKQPRRQVSKSHVILLNAFALLLEVPGVNVQVLH